MTSTIILRFRDLVTSDDETIGEHEALISKFGYVWWGWWMKQHEGGWLKQGSDSAPRILFRNLAARLSTESAFPGYLFDAGLAKLYEVSLSRISVTPTDNKIASPEPDKTPSYYRVAKYPAWFQFRSIREVTPKDAKLRYKGFPTKNPSADDLKSLLGQPIESLEQLRGVEVTLWEVEANKD